MSSYSTRILIVLLTCSTSFVAAQLNSSSPFSRYGIGELTPQAFSTQIGMGEIGAGYRADRNINLTNPASYAYFRPKSLFEVGMTIGNSTVESASTEVKSTNSFLSNVALGINASKRLGLAFGIMPFSNVGYNVSETENVAGVGEVEYRFEGTGGINKAFWGAGYQLINRNDSTILAFGANFSYLFGNNSHSRKTIVPEGFLGTKASNTVTISDLAMDIGLQYSEWISPKVQMTLGASFDFETELKATEDLFVRTYEEILENDITIDTMAFVESGEGSILFPKRHQYGVTFETEHWLFGLDYAIQDWSDYSSTFEPENDDVLSTSQRLSLGMEYTPSVLLSTNTGMFKLASYRLGFQYAKSQLTINGNQMNDIGMSFGIGLPLVNSLSFSSLNMGVKLGQRGTVDQNLVRESYLNLYLGLSLAPHKRDRWFVKRKID